MESSKEETCNEWMSLVIIRHLIFSDLPQLEWEGEYSHFRRVYQQAYQRAREGKTLLWVADLPKKGIIGQCFIQLNSTRSDLANGYDRAYLYAFRIKNAYRNSGLGSRLLHIVENDLFLHEYKEITLNVAKNNTAAIRLYRRAGYEIAGHESGEWSYRDQNNKVCHVVEPAWKMIKYLE